MLAQEVRNSRRKQRRTETAISAGWRWIWRCGNPPRSPAFWTWGAEPDSRSALASYAKEVVAVDYSAAMIERAKKAFPHFENVTFRVADVLALDIEPGSFDVAISQRCLINLTSWEDQKRALENIAGTLKPGGVFVLQEGTRQGRERLNQVREMLSLSRMPPVRFNLDFDEEVLWPFLRRYFEVVDIHRFGLYDLISRVVHPLVEAPEEPQYDAPINEVAARVASVLEGMWARFPGNSAHSCDGGPNSAVKVAALYTYGRIPKDGLIDWRVPTVRFRHRSGL